MMGRAGTDNSEDPVKPVCSKCPDNTFSNLKTQAECALGSTCSSACVDHTECDFGEYITSHC